MRGPLNQGSFHVALLNYQNGIEPDPSDFVSCSQRAPNGFNWARYCRWRKMSTVPRCRVHPYTVRRRSPMSSTASFSGGCWTSPTISCGQSSEIDVIPSGLRGYEPSAISPYSSVAHWRVFRVSRQTTRHSGTALRVSSSPSAADCGSGQAGELLVGVSRLAMQ